MYGKQFESLYSGSMIGSGAVMFAVWGYVIAHRRRDLVELNPILLAFVLGESEDEIRAVIGRLCAPDPRSRSKLEEGRRLVKEGEYVYRVVNARHYDEVANEYERRERDRFRKREERIPATEVSKTYKSNGSREKGVWEINQIIIAKENQAKELFDKYAFEEPTGLRWDNPDKKSEWVKLRYDIKSLNAQIASK